MLFLYYIEKLLISLLFASGCIYDVINVRHIKVMFPGVNTAGGYN